MVKFDKFPNKCNAISKAGITIHLEESEDRPEPLDITLYIKKPDDLENISNLNSEDNITTTGKLTIKFGNRGLIELFIENENPVDNDSIREVKI